VSGFTNEQPKGKAMQILKRSYILSVCLVMVCSFGQLQAAEQEQNRSKREGPKARGEAQRPGAGQRRPGGGGAPFERILNEEQRSQYRKELQSSREEFRELQRQTAGLRRELNKAMFAERFDEGAVRKAATKLAELEAERSIIRARAFAKIRPSLSDEQLDQLKGMFERGRRRAPGQGGREVRRGRGPDGPKGENKEKGRPQRRPIGDEELPPPR
jgi:Spy/CpxP family protein refolding chaperone